MRVSFDDQEYHRRRAEVELEHAVSSGDEASALAHLELARIHRAHRELMTQRKLLQSGTASSSPIFSTDKEA